MSFKEENKSRPHSDKVIVVYHNNKAIYCVWPGDPEKLEDGKPGIPIKQRHMAMIYTIDPGDVADWGNCRVPESPRQDLNLR